MTITELIKHLEDIKKDSGDNAIVAIDVKINNESSTRTEITNISLYDNKDKDLRKGLVTFETHLNVLGSVDTGVLINKKINELIDSANEADGGIISEE